MTHASRRYTSDTDIKVSTHCSKRSAMADLLRIESLRAGYADSVVLNDVSLSLAQGETLALLGRNGTGKTTLLNTVVGVTRRHQGTIQLSGQALEQLAPHVRAQAGIGWV